MYKKAVTHNYTRCLKIIKRYHSPIFQDETLSLTHRSVGICTSRHIKHRGGHHSHRHHNASSSSNNAPNTPKEPKNSKTHEQLLRRYQEHVDGKALIVFPIAFFLFNIGYWFHYLLNLPTT